ncbi:MAG TPA: ABC transporter permease [Candidatus Eremiobacteraeota bacterium]|nr:MAG: Inner membrane ABC transporter permease protein YdcV [bacterium ADurb.Bin363]HPZ10456.1 ABC transporter permease [Candidatus Eremiobacteraeota bacterium]
MSEIRSRKKFNAGEFTLGVHSWLTYIFLYLPMAILVIFSFNKARINAVWTGFTFEWYKVLFNDTALAGALVNSLIVAFISTAIATVIGTLTAIAMYRYKFPGKGLFDSVLYMPIIVPDIVMGISLLSFYVFIRFTLGLVSIIIAHVAFNISFVALVVRARLHGYNKTLDEAAMDLGANPFQTFMKVTLPLILPGVVSAALIAFTLSFDDYLITSFVAGIGSTTLPIKVYSMMKFGVTPEINALSTLILFISMILILISQRLGA